jgi:hypothetical protein
MFHDDKGRTIPIAFEREFNEKQERNNASSIPKVLSFDEHGKFIQTPIEEIGNLKSAGLPVPGKNPHLEGTESITGKRPNQCQIRFTLRFSGILKSNLILKSKNQKIRQILFSLTRVTSIRSSFHSANDTQLMYGFLLTIVYMNCFSTKENNALPIDQKHYMTSIPWNSGAMNQ